MEIETEREREKETGMGRDVRELGRETETKRGTESGHRDWGKRMESGEEG